MRRDNRLQPVTCTCTGSVHAIIGDGTLPLHLKSGSTDISDTSDHAITTGFTARLGLQSGYERAAGKPVSVPANASYEGGQSPGFTVYFTENWTVADVRAEEVAAESILRSALNRAVPSSRVLRATRSRLDSASQTAMRLTGPRPCFACRSIPAE